MSVDFFNSENFIDNYWRKKPVVVRNGSKELLDDVVNEEKFKEYIKIYKEKFDTLSESEDVVFCENISSIDNNLKSNAERNRKKMGVWQETWYDGSMSKRNHGIGAHFDDSDNFVIQQTGQRLWGVFPKNNISEIDIIDRTQRKEGSGHYNANIMDGDFVILNPGDVLYLPIFFPHWGVSLNDSVSMTFAVQSVTPQYIFNYFMKEAFREFLDSAFWNSPVPALKQDFLSEDHIQEIKSVVSDCVVEKAVKNWHNKNLKFEDINETLSIENANKKPNSSDEKFRILEITDGKYTQKISKNEVKKLFDKANEKNLTDFIKNIN